VTDRPKILMAAATQWTSRTPAGSHNLARGFVHAGWDVAFVSNPISPLHVFADDRQEVRDRAAIYRRGGVRELGGHLWAYVPGSLATPHRNVPVNGRWLHRNWSRLTVPSMASLLRSHGFGDVDLLYFDTAVPLFLLDTIRHAKSVFRITDWNPGFNWYTPEMRRLETELASTVDLVAYSATTPPHTPWSSAPGGACTFRMALNSNASGDQFEKLRVTWPLSLGRSRSTSGQWPTGSTLKPSTQ
jgi:hypothetical protein